VRYKQEQIQWRRNKVHDYLVKGMSQYEIADILQVSKATITNDVHFLTIQAKEQMKTHLEEKVPMEFNNCLRGIDQILKSAWEIANNNTLKNDSNNNDNNSNNNNNNTSLVTTTDERLRLQALQLANECYKHKIDLVTNGVIVRDALRFVQEYKQNKKQSLHGNKIENNSVEPIINNAIETF
jgi:hypothetical protein